MKRSILIPLDDETSEKSADEILAEAFTEYTMPQWTRATRMSQFTFYWQESETVLEVVNKINFVKTVEEAEVAAEYIRRHIGLPLKSLPRERNY